MSDAPEIERSLLSQSISGGGRTVKVEIYRLKGESAWTLEIEDEFSNSTVWDDPFESDLEALTEAKKSILRDRMTTYIGPEDGKSNGEWR